MTADLDIAGHLDIVGGRPQLRFRRQLGHAPEKVWRAITEPEHVAAWFPQRIVGEWRPGATLRFVGDGGTFEGEVLACEPPSLLEFRWGPDVIRLEVAPTDTGCFLTLIDTLEEHGKAARDAAGWHVCLDALGLHLDGDRHDGGGDRPPPTLAQRWAEVHPGYVERFGRAAATIGPPGDTAPAGGAGPDSAVSG